MKSRLEWTPHTAKFVAPRRAEDAKLPKLPTVRGTWKRLATPENVAALERGIAKAPSEDAVKRTRLLHAAFCEKKPPSPEEVQTWGAVLTFRPASHNPKARIGLVLGVGGVELAVAAYIARHCIARHPEGDATWVGWNCPRPAPSAQRWYSGGEYDAPRRVLRRALLLAEPDARARARERAAEAWPHADMWLRFFLVGVFFEEHAWACELTREWIEAGEPTVYGEETGPVLLSALPDVDLARRVAPKRMSGKILEMVAGCGVAAAPALVDFLDEVEDDQKRGWVAQALSVIRGPVVAEAFARRLRLKAVHAAATEYFMRFPELARDALGPVADGKSRSAQRARDLLDRVGLADAQVLTAVDEEADEASLPAVLVRPPWEGAGGARTPRVIEAGVGLLPYEENTRFVDDEEHEALVRRAPRRVREQVEAGKPLLDAFLGSIGEAHWMSHYAYQISLLRHLDSPQVAVLAALLLRSERATDLAHEWLLTFPDAAIVGLLPVAVGVLGERRSAAERGLRLLDQRGHGALIRERAAEHEPGVAEAVEEVLASGLHDFPERIRPLPDWWRGFRRPRTKDGRVLPRSAVERIGVMLRFSDMSPTYEGLLRVRDACEPRSLSEFCWDLAKAWQASGSKKSQRWLLCSIIHLADDEVVRRTTPALRSKMQVARVLFRIGSDPALMELATIVARFTGEGWMRHEVEQLLLSAARIRGHSRRARRSAGPERGSVRGRQARALLRQAPFPRGFRRAIVSLPDRRRRPPLGPDAAASQDR